MERAPTSHLDELARELFELALGELLGVDGDAALGAAEGDVHHRRLPRHQRCQAARSRGNTKFFFHHSNRQPQGDGLHHHCWSGAPI